MLGAKYEYFVRGITTIAASTEPASVCTCFQHLHLLKTVSELCLLQPAPYMRPTSGPQPEHCAVGERDMCSQYPAGSPSGARDSRDFECRLQVCCSPCFPGHGTTGRIQKPSFRGDEKGWQHSSNNAISLTIRTYSDLICWSIPRICRNLSLPSLDIFDKALLQYSQDISNRNPS